MSPLDHGSERRTDPDNKLNFSFNQHASRTLERFRSLAPDARRSAISMQKFREGERMRQKLLEFVDTLDGRDSTKQHEFMNRTSEQYDANLAIWQSTYMLNAKDIKSLATKDTVMKWAATVSAETISELKSYGAEPRLKLLPSISTYDLMGVLNQHTQASNEGMLDYARRGWLHVAAPSGSFGLTTDVENIPFFNARPYDIEYVYNSRAIVDIFEKIFVRQGLVLMPQYAYVPSAMDVMTRGQVYDEDSSSGFKISAGDAYLRVASFRFNNIYLDYMSQITGSGTMIRCRPYLPGKKV